MERNEKIRNDLKHYHIYLYELAMMAGISEPTIVRWLREPLTDERYTKLTTALNTLKSGMANC